MKTDDFEEPHWPTAAEMEHAINRAHPLRSAHFAHLARHAGTGLTLVARFLRNRLTHTPTSGRLAVNRDDTSLIGDSSTSDDPKRNGVKRPARFVRP